MPCGRRLRPPRGRGRRRPPTRLGGRAHGSASRSGPHEVCDRSRGRYPNAAPPPGGEASRRRTTGTGALGREAGPHQGRTGRADDPHRAPVLQGTEQRGGLGGRPPLAGHMARHPRQVAPTDAGQPKLVGVGRNPHLRCDAVISRDAAGRGECRNQLDLSLRSPGDGGEAERRVGALTARPSVAGRVTVKQAPSPTRLDTSIRPPCASVNSRAMARPRPAPGSERSGAWKNSSKMNGRSASAMPRPRSSTETATEPPAEHAR